MSVSLSTDTYNAPGLTQFFHFPLYGPGCNFQLFCHLRHFDFGIF